MNDPDVKRLEEAIKDLGTQLRGELSALKTEVSRASSFQVGFQAVSRTLTYVCILAAAAATVYGALIR